MLIYFLKKKKAKSSNFAGIVADSIHAAENVLARAETWSWLRGQDTVRFHTRRSVVGVCCN